MKWRVFFLFIYSSVIVVAGGACRYYYLNAALWREQADKALESSRQQEKALALSQRLQREAAELDKYYIGKLNEATRENTDLRVRLASGSHRVHVTGARLPDCHSPTTSRRVGHDSSVELSGDTGQRVLSVREGIISDQQKLIYLQDYIRRVCLRITEKGKEDENQ